MRKLLIVWFAVSVAATAGIVVYKPFHEAPSVGEHALKAAGPRMREMGRVEDRKPAAVQAPQEQGAEQLALMISIASSIISAFAAVVQTWLTHRAVRAGR